jgi:hypothetical protein
LTAPESVNPAGFLREQLESASPDLLRAMVKTFADALMSADADAADGAVSSRSGRRMRSPPGGSAADDPLRPKQPAGDGNSRP